MEKIRRLNGYQKGILIFMLAMILVFAVIYPKTILRVGFEYRNAILVPGEENGSTVYSGKINGKQARFVVSEDDSVAFYYGDKVYGPYLVKEDPAAIPDDHQSADSMTGVEVWKGEDLLFRGGALDAGEFYLLYGEDGSTDDLRITYTGNDGIERDENGDPVDRMEPSVSTVLKLISTPELTHKGFGFVWFFVVFACMLNAISIIFADELFRWSLSFRVQYADDAEPSDWVIAGRYIGWTAMAIAAPVLFIIGLQ